MWIRYVSDRIRELVLERLSFATAVERIDFKPPDIAETAIWYEDELRRISTSGPLPVVAVDFSSLLDNGQERLASAFQLLNLHRELVARMPLVQLWWIPAFAAPRAEATALYLAPWFQIRMTLSEIAPGPKSELSAQTGEPFRPRGSLRSLKSLQDAVARQRRLADSDPDSYLPPLAAALNTRVAGMATHSR